MKRLAFLLSAAILGVSLCGGASAATLYGTVYFHTGEPAPCTDVMAYVTAEDCDPEDWLYTATTDSCGYYEIPDLIAGSSYDITVIFDSGQSCASGGWTGTCPDAEIICESTEMHEFSPFTNKDWYLGSDYCDNIGCD